MTKFVRLAALAAVTTVVATPAFAVNPSPAATGRVQITKPLTLAGQRNLDFGEVIVWGDGSVQMDRVSGAVTCTANLVCPGPGITAEYKITGSNNQWVTVNTSVNSTLQNLAGDQLTFVASAPASVQLPNSGQTGTTFTVGGAIALLESTPSGIYSGDIVITVNY